MSRHNTPQKQSNCFVLTVRPRHVVLGTTVVEKKTSSAFFSLWLHCVGVLATLYHGDTQ